eukprot:scaffold190317_cov30-Tisochrysis_lutea.AAC.3
MLGTHRARSPRSLAPTFRAGVARSIGAVGPTHSVAAVAAAASASAAAPSIAPVAYAVPSVPAALVPTARFASTARAPTPVAAQPDPAHRDWAAARPVQRLHPHRQLMAARTAGSS